LLLALTLGFDFGLGFSLWAFWCGKLLEGKRMAKEGLIESLHQEL
jgi:hypothetical protein